MDGNIPHQLEILRVKDVMRSLGVGRTSLWRWRQQGKFPAPLQLGDRAIGWRRADLETWLANRPPA